MYHVAKTVRYDKYAGLTQVKLGRALGVTFQQVQKYETGDNRLPVEKLYILRHLYGVPYERFFEGFGRLLKEGIHGR